MKYVPFSSILALKYLEYFSFQSQDEGSALDVTLWEELEDLVLECVLPMAVVLSFSALKASIFLIL